MVGSDDEIWVNVRVERKLWLQFQERCSAREIKPSELLVGLIETYLASPPSPSEYSSDRHIRKIIEDYLQQNLEPQVIQIVEHHLSPPPEERPTQFPPSPELKAKIPKKARSHPANPNLKSAKELAQILGVSPPYITTLNRLGELHKRGWEDSGKRRGKTILYQPISPS
ncbi:MAG: hypothetical protein ACP5D7_13275 [Limnospira sp.]